MGKKDIRSFFISCPPELVDSLKKEIYEVWPWLFASDGRPHCEELVIKQEVLGGLELELPLWLGLELNFFLKLASRILLRIEKKSILTVPKFLHFLKSISLHPYIKSDEKFNIKVEASKSQLNDESKIISLIKEVWPNAHKSSEFAQTIYIRVFENKVSISIDTSGAHLHQRAYRLQQGEAPIRETLAAFCLRELIGETSTNELQTIHLVDAMTGSGTFLSEAFFLYSPSMLRDFAFQKWSSTAKFLKPPHVHFNLQRQVQKTFKHYWGIDKEASVLISANINLKAAKMNEDVFDLIEQDWVNEETIKSVSAVNESKWLVINPPYNLRLITSENLQSLYKKIANKINIHLAPERIAWLAPKNISADFKSKNWAVIKKVPFKNSGIPLNLWIFDAK